MGMERRCCIDPLYWMVNQEGEEPLYNARPLWQVDRSRMSREAHVQICEGVGVRFPHTT